MKKRKKILKFMLAVIAGLLAMSGVPQKSYAAKTSKPYVAPNKVTWIHNGDNTYILYLCALIDGQERTNPNVEFFSEDRSVINVHSLKGTGTLTEEGTLKATGKAYVSAKLNGQVYRCLVKKINPKLNKTSATLTLGKTEKVTLKVSDLLDVNGKKLKCTWNSSNQEVAIVKGGVVQAKSVGKTVITCTLSYKNDRYVASCEKTLKCTVNVKKGGTGEATQVTPALNADVVIRSVEDMDAFIAQANAGDTFEGKTILLAENLDYTGRGFTPINLFKGTFEGKGRSISGIVLQSDTHQGFVIKNEGQIKDLYIQGVSMQEEGSASNIGGIAAENRGRIDGCRVSGRMAARPSMTNNIFGGIAGVNEYGGTVVNCFSQVEIACEGMNTTGVGGGIVGKTANGRVLNCRYDGTMYGDGMEYGCIIGHMTESADQMKNCLSTAKAGPGMNVYGLASTLKGSVENSFFLERNEVQTLARNVEGSFTASRKVSEAELGDGTVLGLLNGAASANGEFNSWKQKDGAPVVNSIYTITLVQMSKGGKVSCDVIAAHAGERVVITTNPKKQYKTKNIAVSTSFMETIISVNNKNICEFTMPEDDVQVKVLFKKK